MGFGARLWPAAPNRPSKGSPPSMARAHAIVFANEKGGTGKSTTAVHVAVALTAQGARVAALDLDHRQQTMTRYLDNRAATARRREQTLPTPKYRALTDQSETALANAVGELSADVDFFIVDTPGRDDPVGRAAISLADTLVTPINDSFRRS